MAKVALGEWTALEWVDTRTEMTRTTATSVPAQYRPLNGDEITTPAAELTLDLLIGRWLATAKMIRVLAWRVSTTTHNHHPHRREVFHSEVRGLAVCSKIVRLVSTVCLRYQRDVSPVQLWAP